MQSERRNEGLVQEGVEDEEDIVDLQPRRGADIEHRIEWDPFIPGAPAEDDLPIKVQIWEDQPVPAGRPRLTRSPVPTETLTPYSYQINRVQVRYQSKNLFEPGATSFLILFEDSIPTSRTLISRRSGGRGCDLSEPSSPGTGAIVSVRRRDAESRPAR